MIPEPSAKALREVRSWLGSKGGKARKKALDPERRSEIARLGGLAKHKKKTK